MDELRTQLKETFATVFAFYLKSHNFHWNVEGPTFYMLHKLFQKIYEDVYDSIDPLAEEIRAIMSYAPGSLTRISELSLIDDEVEIPSYEEMVNQLLHDNEIVIDSLSKSFDAASKVGEQGLMNFLADRIDKHKHWAWFLRATSKKGL